MRGCDKPAVLRTKGEVAESAGVSIPTVTRWFDGGGYLYRCTDYDVYKLEVPKMISNNNNLKLEKHE